MAPKTIIFSIREKALFQTARTKQADRQQRACTCKVKVSAGHRSGSVGPSARVVGAQVQTDVPEESQAPHNLDRSFQSQRTGPEARAPQEVPARVWWAWN